MSLPAWFLLPLGPVIGSWLGVVVQDFGQPGRLWRRSACARCGHRLTALDLIPLLSFLLLRGRCRYCGAAIGWPPLAIELAALAVAIAACLAGGTAWINAGLGWALLAAAWIDGENLVLPDLITLPLLLAGLAVTAATDPPALFNHALAAALGYAGFRLLNALYRSWRHRDGLGAGDAKLLAAAGAWLGLAALPNLILLAALFGIAAVLLRRVTHPATPANQAIPFGPALALAFFALRLTI
jgi:leader peptidase (prepilin peptidase)/N-methyltransferase